MPEAKKMPNQKVQEFKTFVKAHPHVLKKVKSGDKTLQDLFEEWALFGEDDDMWLDSDSDEKTGSEEKTTAKSEGTIGNVLNMIKGLKFDEVQRNIEQFSGAVYSIQEVLSQFQSKPKQPPYIHHQSPFPFRHD
ncbi:YlbD family protein [Guptibacillus algicola]|uniref:YlbD family protein n=1 Tax=Guptibacillus algicola TaxID=225844 RepID=UPI001CD1C438|nr:YlbD family protein [Alkalihalobacillus algicola]MCA0987946.1 YlbD family protein [Alkalihalobacillus algicola]